MKVSQDETTFKKVTLIIESNEEYCVLMAALEEVVSPSHLNFSERTRKAAQNIRNLIMDTVK